jgi:hypothetical protein
LRQPGGRAALGDLGVGMILAWAALVVVAWIGTALAWFGLIVFGRFLEEESRNRSNFEVCVALFFFAVGILIIIAVWNVIATEMI